MTTTLKSIEIDIKNIIDTDNPKEQNNSKIAEKLNQLKTLSNIINSLNADLFGSLIIQKFGKYDIHTIDVNPFYEYNDEGWSGRYGILINGEDFYYEDSKKAPLFDKTNKQTKPITYLQIQEEVDGLFADYSLNSRISFDIKKLRKKFNFDNILNKTETNLEKLENKDNIPKTKRKKL